MATGRDRSAARAERSRDLFARRVETVYANALVVVLAPALNALLLAAFFWTIVPRVLLAGWLGLNLVVPAGRYVLALRFRAASPAAEDAPRWATWFLVSLYLAGASFGSAGVLLFPVDSPAHQALLAFLMGGMIAGAVGAYNALRRV